MLDLGFLRRPDPTHADRLEVQFDMHYEISIARGVL
jgi:hypothetical protein